MIFIIIIITLIKIKEKRIIRVLIIIKKIKKGRDLMVELNYIILKFYYLIL